MKWKEYVKVFQAEKSKELVNKIYQNLFLKVLCLRVPAYSVFLYFRFGMVQQICSIVLLACLVQVCFCVVPPMAYYRNMGQYYDPRFDPTSAEEPDSKRAEVYKKVEGIPIPVLIPSSKKRAQEGTGPLDVDQLTYLEKLLRNG